MTSLDILNPHLREVPEPSGIRGIYFLIVDDEVVYVGQSENIEARVRSHRTTFSGGFDRAAYIAFPTEDLDVIEAAFIRALAPDGNTAIPKTCDASGFVDGLELPPVDAAKWSALLERRREIFRDDVSARVLLREKRRQRKRAARLWAGIEALVGRS